MKGQAKPEPAQGQVRPPWHLPGADLLTSWWAQAPTSELLFGLLVGAALIPFVAGLGLWPRMVALLLLGWVLPGVLWLRLWQGPRTLSPQPPLGLAAESMIALGLGWCWFILLPMLVHWLPGPISIQHLIGGYLAGIVALCGLGVLGYTGPPRPRPPGPWHTPANLGLVALLLIAALLRLPGLGYHEFHVDEVMVLLRARDAIRGEEDALARHPKGPGELAAALAVYRALGTATETTARLPFALTSVASIAALAIAGRRMAGAQTGWWAGLLLALNGFALGLSRLVQYQPAVLLLTILALWAGWEFYRGAGRRWLFLAGIFAAFGLVMHYEVILTAPALLWLVWRGAQGRERATLQGLLITGGVGGLVVGATYLPLILNPFFATTQDYVGNRVGGLGVWNGPFFVEMGTFYNAIYYSIGLVALTIAGLLLGWRRHRDTTIALALWFLVPLSLYLFIMRFPGTHFYLFMPAWALLAGMALATALDRLPRPSLRALALTLIGGWVILSAGYLYLAFFRQAPEYIVNYQTERLPLYWAPYGAQIPEKPRFGLPLRQGWQVLGVLNEWHYLGDTYTSNERSRHLRWYLGGLHRAEQPAEADLIFLATHVQEPDPGFDPALLSTYHPVGEVQVRGEPRLRIFSRQPLGVPYLIYNEANFETVFAHVVPPLSDWPDQPRQPLDVSFGPHIKLTALEIPRWDAARGATLHLTLRWLPLAPPVADWKLFVHLGTTPIVAQWDGLPGQGTARTSHWAPNQPFVDHILLPIPPVTPPGHYPLRVGLYDPATGIRLPLPTGADALNLGTIQVH